MGALVNNFLYKLFKQINYSQIKKLECYAAFILPKIKETDSSTLGLWTAKQLRAKASQPSLNKQRQSYISPLLSSP